METRLYKPNHSLDIVVFLFPMREMDLRRQKKNEEEKKNSASIGKEDAYAYISYRSLG